MTDHPTTGGDAARDPRFTAGFVIDVLAVFEQHGYVIDPGPAGDLGPAAGFLAALAALDDVRSLHVARDDVRVDGKWLCDACSHKMPCPTLCALGEALS